MNLLGVENEQHVTLAWHLLT